MVETVQCVSAYLFDMMPIRGACVLCPLPASTGQSASWLLAFRKSRAVPTRCLQVGKKATALVDYLAQQGAGSPAFAHAALTLASRIVTQCEVQARTFVVLAARLLVEHAPPLDRRHMFLFPVHQGRPLSSGHAGGDTSSCMSEPRTSTP